MAMNDFDRPQPRGQAEMSNVAAEAMGMHPGKVHAPRFHRMSITSAENGYSIDHTTHEEPSDSDRNRESTDPFVGQGPGGKKEITKTHLVTNSHPAYQHVHAIHEALTGGGEKATHGRTGSMVNPERGTPSHGTQNR